MLSILFINHNPDVWMLLCFNTCSASSKKEVVGSAPDARLLPMMLVMISAHLAHSCCHRLRRSGSKADLVGGVQATTVNTTMLTRKTKHVPRINSFVCARPECAQNHLGDVVLALRAHPSLRSGPFQVVPITTFGTCLAVFSCVHRSFNGGGLTH